MKKFMLGFSLLAMLAAGCGDDDSNGFNNENSWPEEAEDICLYMDDITFRQLSYANFDLNDDGMVSSEEAKAVKSIDVQNSDIRSIRGISYFTNLESLNCKGCTVLREADLSRNDKLTTILFEGCSALTWVALPASINHIGEYAFHECAKLTEVNIPEGVTAIGDSAFFGSGVREITIPDSVTAIGSSAFGFCGKLAKLNMGRGVKELGFCAFSNCTSLESIDIPEGVTMLQRQVFQNCKNLRSVTGCRNVTEVGYEAFAKCEKLAHFMLPATLTTIDSRAFIECAGLTTLIIPESVTSIKSNAFVDCTAMTTIFCRATMPPKMGANVFYHSKSSSRPLDVAIYVPTASLQQYKEATNWDDYAEVIYAYDF